MLGLVKYSPAWSSRARRSARLRGHWVWYSPPRYPFSCSLGGIPLGFPPWAPGIRGGPAGAAPSSKPFQRAPIAERLSQYHVTRTRRSLFRASLAAHTQRTFASWKAWRPTPPRTRPLRRRGESAAVRQPGGSAIPPAGAHLSFGAQQPLVYGLLPLATTPPGAPYRQEVYKVAGRNLPPGSYLLRVALMLRAGRCVRCRWRRSGWRRAAMSRVEFGSGGRG